MYKKLSMDAIGSFLKTALYRVIFVLIVGIPAVEVFSFALFGNGVLIQKVDEKNIPASVKLKFDKVELGSSTNTIPGKVTISDQGSRGNNTYPVEINIPNADIRLFKDDATLKVEDGNVIDLNGFIFKIRELPTSGWVLYLTIAWVLGEILCFLGESIIGLAFFDWKPFECNNGKIEKVCPDRRYYIEPQHFLEVKEGIHPNSGNNFQITREVSNNLLLEISEVHLVLSRVLAGLGVFSLITLISIYSFWYSILLIILLIIFSVVNLVIPTKRVSLTIHFIVLVVFLLISLKVDFGLLLTDLIIIFFYFAIIYRTHANKLLYYSTRNNGSET